MTVQELIDLLTAYPHKDHHVIVDTFQTLYIDVTGIKKSHTDRKMCELRIEHPYKNRGNNE